METLEFIFRFTDFLARHRFNVLVLYLEGRIRTPSFPWPSDAESYSPADVRRVVAHAARRGIEVVPVVSTGGHAETFLRHPQLRGLAEMRGPWPGRFERVASPGRVPDAFCPSLEGTWEFLGSYLPEVAAIFPSRWFHAGLDEIWDMACCPLCRRFAGGERGQSALFARIVQRTHGIVTGACRKRMMMWEDMFEHYPSAAARVPRDIALALWHYEDAVGLPEGHFADRRREDKLARYGRLGFETVVVPREFNSRNVETLTDYAARHRPLGGLVSAWEKSRDLYFQSYPVLAFAGRLWSSRSSADADAARRAVALDLFPGAGEAEARALALATGRPHLGHLPDGLDRHLVGPLSAGDHQRLDANALLLPLLRRLGRRARSEEGRLVAGDLRLRLEMEDLHLRMREIADSAAAARHGLSVASRSRLSARIRAWRRALASARAKSLKLWRAARPGIPPKGPEAHFRRLGALASEVAALARGGRAGRDGLLRVRCVLPNAFARQQVEVRVRYGGSRRWTPVAAGVFKPQPLADASHFEVTHLIASGKRVAAVRLDAWGHGGQGILFVEAVNRAGRFVPRRVLSARGRVAGARNVLVDDLRWAWLGDPDAEAAFRDMPRARAVHSLVLEMGPAS
jgi:hypothetical protein